MTPAGKNIEENNLHHSFPGEFINGKASAPALTSASDGAPYHGFSDIGANVQSENDKDKMNIATYTSDMTVKNPILYHSYCARFLLVFLGDDPPLEDRVREVFLELLGEAIPRLAYQGAFPASSVPGVALILT